MINAFLGNTAPQTYKLISHEGTAWADVDKNQKADDSDAYLTLETRGGVEYLDHADLRQALRDLKADQQSVDDQAVIGQLKSQYNDPSLQGLGVVNGSLNFDQLSTYRHAQSFQLRGDDIEYTLQFDPNAPLEAYQGNPDETVVSQNESTTLVRDKDGVLRWELPTAPAAPEPPANAVKEATLVQRDGILHWLYPGEVPSEGDKILGDVNTPADQLLGRA